VVGQRRQHGRRPGCIAYAAKPAPFAGRDDVKDAHSPNGLPCRAVASNHTSVTVSGLWLGGWLFTIGYAHPHFWQIVLAILIWPYYVGDAVAST